jgi:hypothetical protein
MAIVALEHLEAMAEGITREDLEALTPIRRVRLAQLLRHLATLADPTRPADPRAGALARLRDGERAENCE